MFQVLFTRGFQHQLKKLVLFPFGPGCKFRKFSALISQRPSPFREVENRRSAAYTVFRTRWREKAWNDAPPLAAWRTRRWNLPKIETRENDH